MGHPFETALLFTTMRTVRFGHVEPLSAAKSMVVSKYGTPMANVNVSELSKVASKLGNGLGGMPME